MKVTYQRTRDASRRMAKRLNRRLYTAGEYGTFTGKAWCVYRWIRKAGQWLLTGAAKC